MKQTVIEVDRKDIFNHIKLSCQIPCFIKNIAACKIIESTATERGIEVESKELQQAADDFRLNNQLYGSKDTRLWLQKHYLSLDDFEALIYTNTISRKLCEHLFADRVDSFFNEHRLDYVGVVMYEIVLEDRDFAIQLFNTLTKGKLSFHEVAHQYNRDLSLRRSGGYRGVLRLQDLKPEISAAVFTATPPQLLKPIVTSTGVHLILVEEIIQPELNQQLRAQILADLFSDWLKQQVEQVEIVTDLEAVFKVNFVTSN